MTTVREWAKMEYRPKDDKRYVYENGASSKVDVILEGELTSTRAYLSMRFTYPANDVKFEMVSCALRNDGNVSYVMKEQGTEQLVLLQSGDFRIENQRETVVVDGKETVVQDGGSTDDSWNQIVLGLDKLSTAIDTGF